MKYFTLAIVFLLISCETVSTEYVNTEKPFFDLKEFFEQEIELHQDKKVTKKVAIDENSETQTIEQFDMKKALSVFIDCDINKPQLFDKYEIVEKDNQITYTSIDKDLKVQQIEILKNEDEETDKIIINRKADTIIYTSDKILTYKTGKGFSIENRQDVLFSEEKNYSIFVEF
jgi:hypothetical protein